MFQDESIVYTLGDDPVQKELESTTPEKLELPLATPG
jgi:hypothetical protein